MKSMAFLFTSDYRLFAASTFFSAAALLIFITARTAAFTATATFTFDQVFN